MESIQMKIKNLNYSKGKLYHFPLEETDQIIKSDKAIKKIITIKSNAD